MLDDAGGRFTIDATTGEIRTTGPLDHESAAGHALQVQLSDGAGGVRTASLRVGVEDANDLPVLSEGGVLSVAENQPAGTVVGRLQASDADGDAVRFALLDDAGGRFTIDATTGEIRTTDAPSTTTVHFEDFEAGASGWSTNTTTEGGAAFSRFLGRFGGSGDDAAVEKTFMIDDGTSEVTITFDLYEIDSWDGETLDIYLNDVAVIQESFEHRFRSGAADRATSGESEGISWTITPKTSGYDDLGFNDNFIWGSDQIHEVTITITDVDGALKFGIGSHLNQSISDESFGIDNFTLVQSRGDPFVAGDSHEILVQLSDSDGDSSVSTVQIGVGDANSTPFIASGSTMSVPENEMPGTLVGTVRAGDADGDAVRFALLDDAGGRFTIDAATGEVRTTGPLDHETADTHQLRVEMDDGRGGVQTASVQVAVGDVETPRCTTDYDTCHTSQYDSDYDGQTNDLGHGVDITYGSGGDDVIAGDNGNNQLHGGTGDDQLRGGAGNDFIAAGSGDDRVTGGSGADDIYLGEGNDIAYWQIGDGDDFISGGDGASWVDMIELDATGLGTYGEDWTLTLSDGAVVDTGDDYISLTQDAAGEIESEAGVILFEGVEHVQWT